MWMWLLNKLESIDPTSWNRWRRNIWFNRYWNGIKARKWERTLNS